MGVGYGHQVPITVPGKIVACCAFLFGIVAIGLPIHPVISNFSQLYKRHREVKNAFELATKRHEARELEKEKLKISIEKTANSATSSTTGMGARRDSTKSDHQHDQCQDLPDFTAICRNENLRAN